MTRGSLIHVKRSVISVYGNNGVVKFNKNLNSNGEYVYPNGKLTSLLYQT